MEPADPVKDLFKESVKESFEESFQESFQESSKESFKGALKVRGRARLLEAQPVPAGPRRGRLGAIEGAGEHAQGGGVLGFLGFRVWGFEGLGFGVGFLGFLGLRV